MSDIVERLERMMATCIYPKEVREAAAEIERLRARETQAKIIISAAGVYVPHDGGWPAIWHRDADKWVDENEVS